MNLTGNKLKLNFFDKLFNKSRYDSISRIIHLRNQVRFLVKSFEDIPIERQIVYYREVQMSGSISIPFKDRIDSWYGECKISEISDSDDHGSVYVIQHPWTKFSDIDEAVNYFCDRAFTSKNYGYVQDRLRDKGLVSDNTDFENPSSKLKKMFADEAKIVDEESKLIGISVKSFPLEKDANGEFDKIMDEFDLKTISDILIKYKRKYMPLDPYISINLEYEYGSDNNEHVFSYGMNISDINKMYKKRNSLLKNEYRFKYLRITLRIGDEYKNYIK